MKIKSTEIIDTLKPLPDSDTLAEIRSKGFHFFEAVAKYGVFQGVAEVVGATNMS